MITISSDASYDNHPEALCEREATRALALPNCASGRVHLRIALASFRMTASSRPRSYARRGGRSLRRRSGSSDKFATL
jgi:hypothetical protein